MRVQAVQRGNQQQPNSGPIMTRAISAISSLSSSCQVLDLCKQKGIYYSPCQKQLLAACQRAAAADKHRLQPPKSLNFKQTTRPVSFSVSSFVGDSSSTVPRRQ
jgi:hypothetical protein